MAALYRRQPPLGRRRGRPNGRRRRTDRAAILALATGRRGTPWRRTCSCSGSTPTTSARVRGRARRPQRRDPDGFPDADRYRFHPLLSDGELAGGETVDLPGLLDAAQRQVEAFDGPVHAVIGFWDFPVSTMVPMLCERLGLRWASLESVVKCEHKYWSRLEQAKVIDEVPAVRAGRPRRRPGAARRPGATRCGSSRSSRPRPNSRSAPTTRSSSPRPLRRSAGHRGASASRSARARPAGPAARAGGRRRQRLPGRGGGHRGAGDGRGLQLPGRRPRLRDRRLDHLCRAARASCATSTPPTLPAAVAERMAELSAAGHPADRLRRHHLQHRVLLGRRARRDHPAGDQPAPLAVATPSCSSWVDGVANHDHMLRAGAGPRAAAAAPARAPTTSRPSGSCDARPTAWSAGCRRAEEIARVERAIAGCAVEVTVEPGRAPVRAARPGQLQLRDRQRLRRSGRRGRADPQVRAGCRGAAVRDRRRRAPTRRSRLHEDRRPVPARGRRGRAARHPDVGRDPPRRAGLAAGDVRRSGPCRPSWSSSRTASAT